MATCNSYCPAPLPLFTQNECDETVAAGGKTSILFDCDSVSHVADDYSTANVNTDIASGKATVLSGVLVDAPEATPNPSGASYVAGQDPKPKNYTQTITISDENVSMANDDAYETIDSTTGRTIASILTISVDNHTELYRAISGFMITVTKPFAGDVNETIHYVSTITGKMKHKSKMITTPVI